MVGMSIWPIVPTTSRLIFLDKNPALFQKGIKISSLNYENILSVDSSSGLAGGKITVNSAVTNYEFNRLQKDSVKPLVDAILETKSKLSQPNPVATNSPDLLSQLAKLGELKNKGILTEQEFQEHKARLLG